MLAKLLPVIVSLPFPPVTFSIFSTDNVKLELTN
jgi:hypothetical protein